MEKDTMKLSKKVINMEKRVFFLVMIMIFLSCSHPKIIPEAPKTYKIVTCEGVEEIDGFAYPVNETTYFKIADNKKMCIFIDWFDLHPQTKYEVLWVAYHNEKPFRSSNHDFFPTRTHWKTWHFINLDPQPDMPTGSITVRIYMNREYIDQITATLID